MDTLAPGKVAGSGDDTVTIRDQGGDDVADEDSPRARRAAEAAADAPASRPKRFLTPDWDDWDDWDDAESSATPDNDAETTDAPVRGGRFLSDDPEPAAAPAVVPEPAAEEPPAWPAPSTTEPGGRSARHAWSGAAWPESADQTHEQPAVQVTPVSAPTAETRPDWRPIPVEAAPGAARAAQAPSLGEKRRREAPALPTTPPPPSPEDRHEALVARERSGRSVAPGTRPDDDWTDAPLPASAVPPPAVGQAPAPIVVHEGEAPVAHRAYSRPSGETEDEDTLWLTRRPTSRAAEDQVRDAASIATPVSVISAPPVATPIVSPAIPVTVVPSALPPGTPTYGPLPTAWPSPVTVTPPAEATVELPAAAEPVAEPVTPPTPPHRALWRRRPVQIGFAAVIVVIALVAGLLVWTNRGKTTTATNTASVAALVDRLVTAGQLDSLGLGTWAEQKTEPQVTQDSSAPLCFVAAPDLPTPDAQVQRKLTATGASTLNRISSYATAAEATQVYGLRLTQLGACSNIPAYLVSGAKVTSLGDDAVGITAVIQDQTAQFHTVVLVRSGSMVITYDVAQAGAQVAYDKVLPLAATTVTAICKEANGSCSASPTATAGVPPTTSIPGWLAVSDLPRVTVGMGRWNAPAPKTTVSSAGSACENVTFATVAGPNQRRQRTYLLTEDTKAPKNFGLDEVILDFDTPAAATTFANQLKTSIAECPTRTATAKLGTEGAVQATGANGEAITGFWRSLTQSTNATTAYSFRLGVAVVGTRVVYLLANPTGAYDYSDADWTIIVARAGQRATQG